MSTTRTNRLDASAQPPRPTAQDDTDAHGSGDRELRTPDGRYLVVRGRLWRATNPHLADDECLRHVASLMAARRRLRAGAPAEERAAARAAVDAAKVALGERGPVWWTDGAPDYNRRLARNTPYAAWFAAT